MHVAGFVFSFRRKQMQAKITSYIKLANGQSLVRQGKKLAGTSVFSYVHSFKPSRAHVWMQGGHFVAVQ